LPTPSEAAQTNPTEHDTEHMLFGVGRITNGSTRHVEFVDWWKHRCRS